MKLPEWWQPDIPTWVSIALGALALVVSMAMVILNEILRKPRLTGLQPTYNQDAMDVGYKMWHVPILNEPTAGLSSWTSRSTAVGVQATMEFFSRPGQPQSQPISAIWSEKPRPLRDDLVIEAQRADLVAGWAWHLPIVVKIKGQLESYPFNHENYSPDGTWEPVHKRHLRQGDYGVRITLHFEGRSKHLWFLLRNRTDELGVFELNGPFRRNPLSSQ